MTLDIYLTKSPLTWGGTVRGYIVEGEIIFGIHYLPHILTPSNVAIGMDIRLDSTSSSHTLYIFMYMYLQWNLSIPIIL